MGDVTISLTARYANADSFPDGLLSAILLIKASTNIAFHCVRGC
jgi:hypothetical protein